MPRTELDFVSVGPLKTVDCRVFPSDGPTRLVMSGPRAMARLLMARAAGATSFDHKTRENHFNFDEAARRPYPIGRAQLDPLLNLTGMNVYVDQRASERLTELLRRTRATYSRWLPPEEEGGEWVHDPGSIAQADKDEVDRALRHLGWDKEIISFMYPGVLEMGTKRDVLIAAGMGLTKTRTSLCLADYHQHKQGLTGPIIIFGRKKHLFPTWPDEFQSTGLIRMLYGEDCYETLAKSSDDPTFRKKYLLVSFDYLSRASDDMIEKLAEVAKQSVIIVDELYEVANANAKWSKALARISGASHIGLSGSPIKGFPDTLLFPLQWVFRGGSCALPEYPLDREGSKKRFAANYVTYANSEDGRSRKKVPYLKNEEMFHGMIAPLFYRRLRNEPEVIKVLGNLTLEERFVDVKLDPDHIAFYLACVKNFSEWYARELHRRREAGEDAKIPPNEILVKLGYLIRGVSAPWRMKDPGVNLDDELLNGFTWPEYERKPTAIMRSAMEHAVAEAEEGYQVIIFGNTRDPLDLMSDELRAMGATTMTIHGGVNSNDRPRMIHDFKRGSASILCASYGTLAEGVNLANASRVHLTEYDWSPSKVKQAIARITRPDQRYTPIATHHRAPGTIQEYVQRWSAMKQAAIDAALDKRRQSESPDLVPDIEQYAWSLVGYAEDHEQIQPRLFDLELE